MDKAQRIAQLILQQLRGELTGTEEAELKVWISQSPANLALHQQLTNPDMLQPELMAFNQAKANILEKIKMAIEGPKVIPLWKKMVAAASIILAIGLGSYLLFFNKSSEPLITETTDVEAPRVTKAKITLADGRTISVDSLTSISQGTVNVIKNADGKVIYTGTTNEVVYNTLSNPRGSKVIDMQLSDGSHVWLNAGSSVTYPIAFAGTQRSLSITGEAYFEVSPDKAKPFIVTKGATSVTVLGTHFNVNAFDDEATIDVTLLEGSVKVASPGTSRGGVILKPGQQAQVAGEVKVASNVDVEQVMAWKNGLFDFNKTEIGEIMRQVERWYDMQVVYPDGKPKLTLSGNISRDINASKVLEMLEMSGIHFTIEGKRIIVKP